MTHFLIELPIMRLLFHGSHKKSIDRAFQQNFEGYESKSSSNQFSKAENQFSRIWLKRLKVVFTNE